MGTISPFRPIFARLGGLALLAFVLCACEMFGFQLLGGKPFHFYQKDNRVHVSYDNQDLPLEYDTIPHYNCCSAAELNPRSGPNWIGFFGRREKTWYYAEILTP